MNQTIKLKNITVGSNLLIINLNKSKINSTLKPKKIVKDIIIDGI